MNDGSITVQAPRQPGRLVLLFHGVGASADHLVPVGKLIASGHPDAMVVSVQAPHPSGLGAGREWFSVLGVTEEDRPQRIAAAMPQFRQAVADWQATSGVGADRTTRAGSTQGAIMSRETPQLAAPPLASRVVALAGRFAVPVRSAPAATRFHFIHGAADTVIPVRFSVEAAHAIEQRGGLATLDGVPGLGHGIDERAAKALLEHLADR